ncbi:hypothetical protein DV737_g774, partial [Chaetothyriales sp. CBS 132003]
MEVERSSSVDLSSAPASDAELPSLNGLARASTHHHHAYGQKAEGLHSNGPLLADTVSASPATSRQEPAVATKKPRKPRTSKAKDVVASDTSAKEKTVRKLRATGTTAASRKKTKSEANEQAAPIQSIPPASDLQSSRLNQPVNLHQNSNAPPGAGAAKTSQNGLLIGKQEFSSGDTPAHTPPLHYAPNPPPPVPQPQPTPPRSTPITFVSNSETPVISRPTEASQLSQSAQSAQSVTAPVAMDLDAPSADVANGRTVPVTKKGASEAPARSGLLSASLFGGESGLDSNENQATGPNIVLHIDLKDPKNKVINFARMAEEKYGFAALYPRQAAQRERLARVAAAGAALERSASASKHGGTSAGDSGEDDVSVDIDRDSDNDGDVNMGGFNGANEPANSGTDGPEPKRRRRKKVEEYDQDDPFIDDSEQLWETQAAASKDGFFVYSGPLVPEGEKATVERADGTVRRGRGRGRGGGPGSRPGSRGGNAARKPRGKKADRQQLQQEKEKEKRENGDSETAPAAAPAASTQARATPALHVATSYASATAQPVPRIKGACTSSAMNGLPDFYAQDYAPLDHHQRPHDGYAGGEGLGGEVMATAHSQTLEQLLELQHPYRRRQTLHSIYQASDSGDHQTDQQHTIINPRRAQKREDLALSTQFSRMNASDYGSTVSFSPAIMSDHAEVDHDAFMPGPMDMSLDFSGLANDIGPLMAHSTAITHPIFGHSPVSQVFPNPYSPSNHDPVGSATMQAPIRATKPSSQGQLSQRILDSTPQLGGNMDSPGPLSIPHGINTNTALPSLLPQARLAQPPRDGQSAFPDNLNLAAAPLAPTDLGSIVPRGGSPAPSRYHSVYSSSGFDMVGALMRVATRKKPEINIGPVDMSCAFVVCDIGKHDLPIVYCSDMFERLTGYSRSEILGRNCRFLQAPDGKVESGVKRKYVDDRSVLYLKTQIQKRAEAQLSLINYRKGGQPFMNLLTMIPIPWDTEAHRFFVGFQVDLVEQPGSLSGKNPDGTYSINYNCSDMPPYSLPAPPDPMSSLTEIGQTISRDEVSRVLATTGGGDTDLSTRIWDKVLLENTDDVVHVLSLKGLFLYLSPASRRVLEYDATELVGTPLSSVCHPSDIVPVTRELKDSAGGAAVNVVYRIRRKKSGYTWFEAHGCLHTEQGKGRKCIILVGRSRPVYALDKNEISADCGPGDGELWSKLSTAGLILYTSSNSRQMLDRLPEDLVGTSLQALMRPDSKKEFLRGLECARTGEKVTLKHDLQNRRGQVLHAQTTLYPGDAKKGSKPTFLLGQTRLIKLTRASLSMQKSTVSSAASIPTHSSTDSPAFFSSSHPTHAEGLLTSAGGGNALPLGNQDEALASEDNIFDELKTTRSSSWQFELRQMERQNRLLAEELQGLISRKKKRKRRKGLGQLEKDCANCHTRNGRVSPRKYGLVGEKSATSPCSASSVNAGPGPSQTADATSKSNQPTKYSEQGNLPPQIAEAVEPPHPTVLPT